MSDPELTFRIGELERKLAHLYRHLGVAEPLLGEGLSPEVQQALLAGNKIEAIRIQREQTGMGLAQAKAAVEGFSGPQLIE
jgi:ribosomal protein L7/L12